MADKREQCEKCTMNCPPNIIQTKINKGRIPFDKCMDFSPIQTNADRIRSMTDEELAEFVETHYFYCADHCEDFGCGCAFNCTHGKVKELILNWLKSEAE